MNTVDVMCRTGSTQCTFTVYSSCTCDQSWCLHVCCPPWPLNNNLSMGRKGCKLSKLSGSSPRTRKRSRVPPDTSSSAVQFSPRQFENQTCILAFSGLTVGQPPEPEALL